MPAEPYPKKKASKEEIHRFIKKHLFRKDGCDWWQRHVTKSNYAKMWIGSSAFTVRRILIWINSGYLPKGQFIKDTCGNKDCCNPDHFHDETPQELRTEQLFRARKNTWDKRFAFTREQAENMDTQLLLGETTVSELARRHNVTRATIYKTLKKLQNTSGS